jgi:hypothetical protein
MPFKNGHKKVGGRQKGSANKENQGFKKEMKRYLEGLLNDGTFRGWLESDELPIKDKITSYLKALEFVMPKQQKIELDGDIHTNLIQVQFESTNVLPIHSETEFLDD